MSSRFSVEAVFKAVDRVTRPVTRMQKTIGRFTQSMQNSLKSVNKGWDSMHKGIKSAAKAAVVGIGLIAGAGTALAQSGLDFEQAIVNVGAVSLQTRDQIAPLEAMALKLGATTTFTATQAANAMETLARAGFNNQQILDATPAVLSAAAASGMEIAEVADHVSNVLKGMGLDMTQASRVSDVLALASARTNSSIGSLGESMRNVAATARQLGVPLEEAVASVALLQDVGLDASVAGSAFNTMLTNMAKPSKEIARKMRRMGVSFKDAQGNMLPLNQVLEQLSKASAQAGGSFDKVAFMADLVGLRGQKAAANLAELFDQGKVEALTKELQNATGAADKMAKIRLDTTRGSLTLLGSAVDGLKVKIFGMNNGPLKEAIDNMTAWVTANEDLIATRFTEYLAKIITNLPEIVTWLERIGKALVAFYAFGAVLKTVTGLLTLFNLVAAANPIVLITLGILAAVAAFAALVYWLDDVVAWFDKLHPAVKVLLAPFNALIHAMKWVKDNWEAVAAIGDKVAGMFDGDNADNGVAASQARQARRRGGVVSPQERTARSIEESRSTSTAEVTIKDQTGRAEVTGGKLGAGISLVPSGAF